MSPRFRPLALVVAAATAAWLVSVGTAHQPPAAPKAEPFTAFPDLKVTFKADGFTDDGKLYGRLLKGHPRPIPPNAPPLRKVKIAQLNEGAEYVTKSVDVIRIGKWTQKDYLELLRATADVYRVGAELTDDPGEKVGWYEDRVVMFKLIERFIQAQVETGVVPPQELNLARFHRLQAEAELLEFKAAMEKAGKR